MLQQRRNSLSPWSVLLTSAVLAGLLLAAPSHEAWSQDCVPDFRPRSTKQMVPLTSDPIEPGGTVEITLHICNDGDPPFGPGCGNGEIVVQDWLFTNFYFENPAFTYWDPTVWQNNDPGPPCRVLANGNVVCATNVPGVFDPANPTTGGCTDVILEADVRKEIPEDQLCNQAFIQRGTGPLLDWCSAQGGGYGCTSPANNPDTQQYTCIPLNINKDLRGTKKIIAITGGSDPDILEAGETITYEICLENHGNSVLKLVNVRDYIPADVNDDPLIVPQAPDCAINFTQTPDVGARLQGTCIAKPPYIAIFGRTEADFWLYPIGDPDGPSQVCFTYDLITRNDLTHTTELCNNAIVTWQGNTTDFPVPMDGSAVCEQVVDGPHFAGSTKTVDDTAPTQGSQVTFSLHIENIGNQAASGIVIDDLLSSTCFDLSGFDPLALNFSPADPNTWTASMTGPSNNNLHIEIDDQIPSKSFLDISFTVQLAAGATGTCCNTAVITSPVLPNPEIKPTSTVDPNPTKPDETLTCFDIGGAAILDATKSVAPTGDVTQGDSLTYTITLENVGSQDATQVSVVDTLDSCLDCSTFVDDPALPDLSVDCVSGEVSLQNYTVPGNSGPINLVYTIDVDTSARLWPPCCNEAFVSYRRVASDPASVENLTTNKVCNNVLPLPVPGFSFLKDEATMSFPRYAAAGSTARYVLTVENTGTMDASITIVDTFDTCLDISNFNPATSVTMQPGTPLDVRLNARTLEIDVDLPWGGPAEVITLQDISIDVNAPPGICSNQATFDFGGQTWVSDDPANPLAVEPTDINVIRMGFTKDVANMGKPRQATPGTPIDYVLTIDNTDGVDGPVTITDRFDACIDISAFDPAIHVSAVPGPLTDARIGGFPPPGRTLTIELDLSSAVAQQVITVTGIAIDLAAPLGQSCDNQATLRFSGATWRSNDPESDPPLDDPTDIMVGDTIPDRLRREVSTDACPLTAKPSDIATIFDPRPSLIAGGPLPWEFAGDLPSPPGSESCLIFYESDDAARIAVLRGQTNPGTDVRLQEF